MSALAEAPDRPEGAADDPGAAVDIDALAATALEAHEAAVGAQLTLDAGGEKPTVSEFKLAGRSIELEGEFEKGSTTVLKVGIEWTAIEFVDKHDSETGQIVSTTRRHKGRIVSYDVES
jgi:hypothetical protein